MANIELRCDSKTNAELLKSGLLYAFGERNGSLQIAINSDELGYFAGVDFDAGRISQDELTGFWQCLDWLQKGKN